MKQGLLLCAWSLLLLCDFIVCPPVTDKPETTTLSEKEQEDLDFGLEYERYLKEVVGVLESDETFRKKLEESNITDIKVSQLAYDKYLKEVMALLMTDANFSMTVVEAGVEFSQKSGEIARHLDFVGHGIRTKLDEIKRKEVDRLRQIIRLQSAMKKGTDDDDDSLTADTKKGIKDMNFNFPELDKHRLLAHIDHGNPNSFEIEDLSKLIKQATKDLEDIDAKRRDEFKNYEMEKEHLRKKQLEQLDEDKRAEEEKKFEEAKKLHAKHPDLHHPGGEAQLEEVWEEADGLNKKDFDPRTFFFLHDTNGDGMLDEPEVEALFQKELDKVYDPNAPEDDMMERFEEMNRMREHVMNEVDKNQDKLISLEEFLDSTKTADFVKDEAWDTLENQTVYTDEELAEFEKQYEELRVQKLQNEQPLNHQQGDQPNNVHAMQQADVKQQHGVGQEQPVVHEQLPQAVHHEQPAVNHEQQPQAGHQEQQVDHHEQQPAVH